MISSELCAGNLFPAIDFAKLMNYDGPWIAAGDGTKVAQSIHIISVSNLRPKLRPLLTMSTEFSGKDSAHVVGSTLPLCDVRFTNSQEQSKIISDIDTAKAIATQVWVLAIKVC
jgi:hypothetical protein